MIRSTERILTSHTGSLPRTEQLRDRVYAVQDGAPRDDGFWGLVEEEVFATVGRQRQAAVDLINDGEVSKPGCLNYLRDRMQGLGGEADPWGFRDMDEAPDLERIKAEQYESVAAQHIKMPACVGPLAYVGEADVRRDIDYLTRALGDDLAAGFMTASSPGCLAIHVTDHHYGDYQDYLYAIADAMSVEYRLITDAGLVLQLDCPDLPSAHPGHGTFWMSGVIEEMGYEAWLELQIDALNRATDGIGGDQLRLHLCWSNYKGPHDHDVALSEVLEPVLRLGRPNTISFEGANPRHVHEWRTFETLKVPDEKVLMPGVIDSLTNVVEHPEAVAQRIELYAGVVGPERVVAGTDCGFGTFVGFGEVVPSVAWKKLESLSTGAAIASKRLFG